MIDRVNIIVKAGKGGDGSISFHRAKFIPQGGPNGGIGGRGGDVYIASSPSKLSLTDFIHRYEFTAENGRRGSGNDRSGAKGKDLKLEVPLGTEIWVLQEGNERLVADLVEEGEMVLVARGGSGGKGNRGFASSTNRAPLLAEEGEAGEELGVRLDFKFPADIGIVGLPNTGKSTLLASSSGAHTKIGDYSFTTNEPEIGVIEHKYQAMLTVDMPALVEGAHSGEGLGNDFLRHIERALVIIYLLDGVSEDVLSDLDCLRAELQHYSESLVKKPSIIAVNKIDLPQVRQRVEDIKGSMIVTGTQPVFISAIAKEGLEGLWEKAEEAVKEARRSSLTHREMEVPVLKPKPRREKVSVRLEGREFIVDYSKAERIIAMADLEDWRARVQLLGTLERIGVGKALREKGLQPGDTVRFGPFYMEWQ